MSKTRKNYVTPSGLVIANTYERVGEWNNLKDTDGIGLEIHVDMRIYDNISDCRAGKPWSDRFKIVARYHPGTPKLDDEGNPVLDENEEPVMLKKRVTDFPESMYLKAMDEENPSISLKDVYKYIIDKAPEYNS